MEDGRNIPMPSPPHTGEGTGRTGEGGPAGGPKGGGDDRLSDATAAPAGRPGRRLHSAPVNRRDL